MDHLEIISPSLIRFLVHCLHGADSAVRMANRIGSAVQKSSEGPLEYCHSEGDLSLLRRDRALQALLGLNRFHTDDPIRNLFVDSTWAKSNASTNHWLNGRYSVCGSEAMWTWIRPSSNVMASRKARSAIIRRWPC
jgi:hypothetical protein